MATHELDITTMAHGGSGIGRVDGRVVFTPGVIPGEIVEVEIVEDSKKSLWRAQPLRVLSPSPHRIPHIWPERKGSLPTAVGLVGNVPNIARGAGIRKVTGDARAHKAGIFTSDAVDVKQREFFRLRAEGVPCRDAAKRLEIEGHQASCWDKGIRVFLTERVLADNRVVLYRQDEILANVKRPGIGWVQGEWVPRTGRR